MFPAQTSFIPTTVALVRYIETNGFSGNYPFWYFGTTPLKYLIGPVVPGILVGVHKVLPNFSLFELSYLVIFASLIFGAVGWGVLAFRLSGKRMIGVIGGLGVLILPWRFFSTMAFGEVTAVVASALTPWVLWTFARSVRHSEKTFGWLPSLTFAFLLLVNSTASIPAIVGLLILGVVLFKHWGEGLKGAMLVIVIGWILSMVWYGPNYYLTVFGAPSIGGKSALSAFVTLFNLLRGFVPLILAVVLVWWRVKPKTVFEKFTLLWIVVFGSLTLFRFLSDFDFWMDWTAWIGEVEVGFALVVGYLFARGPVSSFSLPASALSGQKSNDDKVDRADLRAVGSLSRTATPRKKMLLILFSIYSISCWLFVWQNRNFWMPKNGVEKTVEYTISNKLAEIVKPNETVFLSGSTAFWLNSLVDVKQVRGGRDEASVNNRWREINWRLTQGVEIDRAVASLKSLGVDFIVVHGNTSEEYYHDFNNPDKFESLDSLVKVHDEAGDIIYKIK